MIILAFQIHSTNFLQEPEPPTQSVLSKPGEQKKLSVNAGKCFRPDLNVENHISGLPLWDIPFLPTDSESDDAFRYAGALQEDNNSANAQSTYSRE